jgi:hypothetical protein
MSRSMLLRFVCCDLLAAGSSLWSPVTSLPWAEWLLPAASAASGLALVGIWLAAKLTHADAEMFEV